MEGRLDIDGVKTLLLDPEAMGSVLFTLIVRALGDDAIHEDPLVVYSLLNNEYDIWMTEEGENRYEAINLAFTTDLFYTDLESWMAVTSVLYEGTMQDLRLVEPNEITIPEILWAHYEVDLVRDHTDEMGRSIDLDLAPSIKKFINDVIVSEVADDSLPEDPEDMTPYYSQFIEAQKRKLVEQFNLIGLPVSLSQLPSVEEALV